MINHLVARLTVAVLMLTAPTTATDRADADAATDGANSARRLHGNRGQATTEYALVLLAAALVALMVVAWATAGGGAAKVARLFNRVIDSVIEKV